MATREEVLTVIKEICEFECNEITEGIYDIAIQPDSHVCITFMEDGKRGDHIAIYRPLWLVEDVDLEKICSQATRYLSSGIVVWRGRVCIRTVLPLGNIYGKDLAFALLGAWIDGVQCQVDLRLPVG